MESCPCLTPVLWAAMRESSVVPDRWMSLPLTVAFVPVTWAVGTLIGVLGVIPSVTKLLCRAANVALPAADMQTADDRWAVSPGSLMSWQAALRLPAAT